jgi:hypothetical protein
MERAIDESKLLKVDELAEWLGVKESWVYVHADELGAYHLGKYLRFSLSRVLKILERGAIGAPNVNLPTQRPLPTSIKKGTFEDHGTT